MNIWWIRNDLRLFDNQALHLALGGGSEVVPLFILDEDILDSDYIAEKRVAFLFGGLRALQTDIADLGGRLIVRRGKAREVLAAIVEETGATAVYAQEDYTPYSRERDADVAEKIKLIHAQGRTIHPIDQVLKDDGDPYVVFTPYKRRWLTFGLPDEHTLIPTPENLKTPSLSSDGIPDDPQLAEDSPFEPGERAARQRLQAFRSSGLGGYDAQRDLVAVDGTSQLSPYLHLGMLSPREAFVEAQAFKTRARTSESKEGAETWISELVWREFYNSILYHYPRVLETSFREEYDQIEWRTNTDEFEAWCAGKTGYPLVDAAMRQLNELGWMHNRARMVVASFLIKDLLIDWRWGERYFMQQLIDGHPASNNGGWQWAAGTGTDAAPYFRIFNPVSQSTKHDKKGEYIRRWVGELQGVPDKYIHEPWKMPQDVQEKAGCKIGEDYPEPIVDHKEARQRTLDAYKAVKG